MSKIKKVENQPDFPELEEKINAFWKRNNIFQKSIDQRTVNNTFSFLDGPPFPSGMPHYGHLLMSAAKDVVPRYWTMKGKRVRRVFGWDCHGIAVESKVNKELNISTRKEIEKFGIENYVKECRKYVENCIANWRWYIERVGRWVDMDNAYYTMYPEYHESVLWAFKQLWEKGYVYKGKRVSLFSVQTGTPVSDFEVAEANDYRDIEELAIFVKFKLKYTKSGYGVGIVIHNEKGQVLLMKRNEPGREQTWALPGGKMDTTDKDLYETVSRELLEELGVKTLTSDCYAESINIFEGRLYKTYYFKATVEGQLECQSHEIASELRWFSKDELPWGEMYLPTQDALKKYFKNNEQQEVVLTRPDVHIVAWTTTPWTIPSNFALAVNPNVNYCLVEFEGENLVVAKARLEYTFNTTPENIGPENGKLVKILKEFKGTSLAGLEYEPVFPFFTDKATDNDFKIYLYEGVTIEDGTGVLHLAPAFGEEDFNLGKQYGLSDISDIDEEGKMTVDPWKGIYLRDASPLITEDLQQQGRLFRSELYTHRLPFYRGNEPLIYMAQDSYFINLQNKKERMLNLNEKINWIPENVKTTRFPLIIKSSPDWCISRNRYWATIMPLWRSKDGDEIVVGSFEEMMQYTNQIEKKEENGRAVYYINGEELSAHRDKCDQIILRKEGKEYFRVPEVLDVWLDSGSAPFAEYHYPFENKEIFEKAFPADFIVEGAGMVRAWFNVLHRVSTLVFDTNAFKNVICAGTFAGNDGRKMSKTYGNYTDPKDVLENLGGETLRLYLVGSTVMAGGEANWSDELLKEQQKNILIPLWNTYKYLSIYAELHDRSPEHAEFTSTNILDKWLESYLNKVTLDYSKAIESYNLPESVKLIQPTIDNISSWWIRRSRDRFANGDKEALQTLYAALVQFIKTFAPQMPFATEEIYQNLVAGILENAKESVHLEDYPSVSEDVIDYDLLEKMELIREICSIGQNIRVEKSLKLKQPLSRAIVTVDNGQLTISNDLLEIIKDELNVKVVELVRETPQGEGFVTKTENGLSVTLDTNLTQELKEEGLFAELKRQIQNLRKTSGLKMGELVNMRLATSNEQLRNIVTKYNGQIKKEVSASNIELVDSLEGEKIKVDGNDVAVSLTK